MTDAVWMGSNKPDTMADAHLKKRKKLAAAAKAYDWSTAFGILEKDPDLINATNPGGRSLFTPLHQAAHGGASVQVVTRLLTLGAWRTIENARGERAVDVAARCGHMHLIPVLAPECKHDVPLGVLRKIQEHFHAVIRGRADALVREHELRLPDLSPLLELEGGGIWFAVPGMYGGFRYWLDTFGVNAKLLTESWCRVESGSGQRHAITSQGYELVDEGFV